MFGFNPYSTVGFSELEQAAQVYSLAADTGAYTITGGSATFIRGKQVQCSAGSYVLTGSDATFIYEPIAITVVSKGGLPKAKATKKYKEESELRAELEKIVKDEFDKLDGTYVAEAVEAAKQEVMPQIKKIEQFDDTEYKIVVAQINALLLQAKIRAAEIESEMDDEQAILMLL